MELQLDKDRVHQKLCKSVVHNVEHIKNHRNTALSLQRNA